MARLVDLPRRTALLDDVITYLGENGLASVSLRPMARALGVSVNSLMHHFGSKDDLIIAALRRSGSVQQEVEQRWLSAQPQMSQADLLRSWWRWITASQQNLAIVRLGIEAAAMEATRTGLPRHVRSDQIGLWRANIEDHLISAGVPKDTAEIEASLAKAMFTGLVVDLLATGQKARLTRSLEVGLARLEQAVRASAVLPEPHVAANGPDRERSRSGDTGVGDRDR